ncbi:DUF4381 domain-containing protein [Pseudohaliea rubra]|uniref:DUF4381 domain-containing protein n=1 Tax=Pseudohaliea rubra DSM 19751 TaxID=1265313 RepID=A0A095XX13_9GAMM|nr:DUF4381 domain-containing protein [Pseudohaliea rubra]KGE04231.1 hypothetical protein HRUBRA_01095 [Pseudohaliea rubra DSM 19751]
MNPQDPLAALKPLRTPPPVEAWPPAPGWWVLAALGLIAVLILALLALRAWRRRAFLRAARRELAELRARLGGDPAGLTAAVNTLLKRVALACYPRRDSAALSGRRWLAFLDATAPAQPFAAVRDTLPYEPSPAAGDAMAFCEAAEHWLRAQRPGRPAP